MSVCGGMSSGIPPYRLRNEGPQVAWLIVDFPDDRIASFAEVSVPARPVRSGLNYCKSAAACCSAR